MRTKKSPTSAVVCIGIPNEIGMPPAPLLRPSVRLLHYISAKATAEERKHRTIQTW